MDKTVILTEKERIFIQVTFNQISISPTHPDAETVVQMVKSILAKFETANESEVG
jgi:hypothetical protein